MTGRAHECASAAIALPDGTPGVSWNRARVDARAARSRIVGRGELPPLELEDQGIERTIEHLSEIAGGNRVAEQRLRIAQFVVRFLSDRDLKRCGAGGATFARTAPSRGT
jgi:hypothetical protein